MATMRLRLGRAGQLYYILKADLGYGDAGACRDFLLNTSVHQKRGQARPFPRYLSASDREVSFDAIRIVIFQVRNSRIVRHARH